LRESLTGPEWVDALVNAKQIESQLPLIMLIALAASSLSGN